MAGSALPPGVVADATAAVKEFARVGGAEEEALTGRLVASAIGIAEAFCGVAIVRRGFEDVLAPSGGWQRLRQVPVAAISGVVGMPAGSAPIVLPVDSYRIDIDGDGGGWVRVTGGTAERIAIDYVAGLAADWAAVPAPVAQGIAMLAAHLLARPAEATPPAAVAALWRPYRRMRLAAETRA